MASLRRIRSLVTSDEVSGKVGRQGGAGGAGGGAARGGRARGGGIGGRGGLPPSLGTGGSTGGRRESSQPDAAAVFRGVRALLEQNLGDQPGSEEVCLCLLCLCLLR